MSLLGKSHFNSKVNLKTENQTVKGNAKRSAIPTGQMVFGKRIPLANSMRQNTNKPTVGFVDDSRDDTLKKTTRSVTSKAISAQQVNDENACVSMNSLSLKDACKSAAFPKSRVPVETVKRQAEIKPDPVSVAFEFYKNKEEVAFSTKLLPKNVENIDAVDKDNVMLAPEYINDIYTYLRNLEDAQSIRPNFLSHQTEMTARMRSVLVDWLISVHLQFRLLPETLYLGISIMDRFFQKEVVSKDKIQLVGVTAFFIASKFEEIYPPDIKDFVIICDSLYHKRDIIKMEMAILKTLKFELGRPLPLHFLRRNSKAAHADIKIHSLAKYLMELCQTEYDCASWNPSLLAAACLYVTMKILGNNSWTPTLAFYSNYSEEELLPKAVQLCKVIKKSEKSKFQNCRKKYSTQKFMGISTFAELKSDIVDEIAAADC